MYCVSCIGVACVAPASDIAAFAWAGLVGSAARWNLHMMITIKIKYPFVGAACPRSPCLHAPAQAYEMHPKPARLRAQRPLGRCPNVCIGHPAFIHAVQTVWQRCPHHHPRLDRQNPGNHEEHYQASNPALARSKPACLCLTATQVKKAEIWPMLGCQPGNVLQY